MILVLLHYLFPETTSPSGYSYVIDGFNGFGNTNYDKYRTKISQQDSYLWQTANQVQLWAPALLDWFRFGIKVQGGAEYNNTYGAWLDFGDDPCQSDTMNQSWAQPENNPVSFGFIFKIGGEIYFVTNDNL